MSSDAESAPKRPPRPCPICGKMSVFKSYPFCSPRCRAVDLNRWLTGAYAIPVVEDDDMPDDPSERER
ncbi:DNA gyrase inhibitor YacG [Methyloraptor flagellatus]|uniref:DNA gyrase inhibitor YacG n=1 Tax=Methyloraptor flagellatus TaxID=3162530 RepID=A0AAU7XBE8_9HYPH